MSKPYRNRLLPGIFLIVGVLALQPLMLSAQQDNREAANVPEPQPRVSTPEIQVTPENVGDAYLARRHYQQEIAAYKKIPVKSADVWNKMGVAYELMFDLKDAEACFKKSLHIDRHNARVMNNLGTVYDSMKKYRAAERMYRKAIKADPNSAVFRKNLGTNLLTRHKYEKGLKAYQQALALDPQIFDGHGASAVQNPASLQDRGAMNYYMAKSCVEAGQEDLAIRFLRRALNQGFTSAQKVAEDGSFAPLHDNPAFQKLLAEREKH